MIKVDVCCVCGWGNVSRPADQMVSVCWDWTDQLAAGTTAQSIPGKPEDAGEGVVSLPEPEPDTSVKLILWPPPAPYLGAEVGV